VGEIAAGGVNDKTARLRFVLETVGKIEWSGRKVPEEYAMIVERTPAKRWRDEESGIVAINPDVPP